MNEGKLNPEDARLRSLLRDSRASPALPPRFREGVWRRIENTEAGPSGVPAWLEVLVAGLLRPRLAFALIAALVLIGALLGVHDGSRVARQQAQARYVQAVAPDTLR